MTVSERAARYLTYCPGAISGSGGHDTTFRVAIALVHGFCLSQETAYQLLLDHYNLKCSPPWNDAELRHKITSVCSTRPIKGSGYLLGAAGPFYGFNRPGVKTIEPLVWNWWRQGMMGGAKAGYDGIVAFSQTDFTEDLKKINVPVLVMHSEDDQIVPYQAAGPLSAKLLKNGTLKTYRDLPHGMITTHADVINADLLAFFKA